MEEKVANERSYQVVQDLQLGHRESDIPCGHLIVLLELMLGFQLSQWKKWLGLQDGYL